ncbi:DUF4194 domain-containing protein [Aquabacterium sp. A7-Y]|uniref:DUF4194 domain-containing protein n=1 Tax=Aquabacterium sp. A7-Y TaxID=1349605 RepID=UPI00223CE946|nr:DUF4194 domain-containing protein [Aquabacterium sp. A7-Y]MCW7537039.1 DUF4194 domain-containing protein [Aquabacterium sp. A7-Y]
MSLTTSVQEQLAQANLSRERFRELITRLLSWGVLVRDEDRTEQLLYDDARRVEGLLSDYFDLAGLLLHHDSNAQFFRLYGPGAVVDGLPEDTLEPVPSLKARVSADFVAAALALRFLYQERLNGGYIDPQGEALVSFEDLAATLQTQIKRPLPAGTTDRMALLAELKRHRLLRYASTFSIADEDAYLAIRPTILGVVSNDALAAALEAEGRIEAESEAAAEPAAGAAQAEGVAS